MLIIDILKLVETRSKNPSSSTVLRILFIRFPNHLPILGTGYGKGIWILWNHSQFKGTVLCKSYQHIAVKMVTFLSSFSPFILLAVYASTNWVLRRDLWKNLYSLGNFQNHDLTGPHVLRVTIGSFFFLMVTIGRYCSHIRNIRQRSW